MAIDTGTSPFNSTGGINPYVSVDCVIFGFEEQTLKVLLIERGQPENSSLERSMAIPGDLIFQSENPDDAARRVLFELTSLRDLYLYQFHTFGDPRRMDKPEDVKWLRSVRSVPEAHVITVAYYSLVNIHHYQPSASGFARNITWIPFAEIPALAFDHNTIIETALVQLREHVYRKPLVFELLPEYFTLADLQTIYEVILQTEFDKRNFRRKVLSTGFVESTDRKQRGVAHKPAVLFRFNKEKYENSRSKFIHF